MGNSESFLLSIQAIPLDFAKLPINFPTLKSRVRDIGTSGKLAAPRKTDEMARSRLPSLVQPTPGRACGSGRLQPL